MSGKTLQEHLAIQGHSDAVKSLVEMAVGDKPLNEQDIFRLHCLIQTTTMHDVYRPVGAWKMEDNGTQFEENGKIVWHDYPPAHETPKLMKQWISRFNVLVPKTWDDATLCYAKAHLSFVSIHPFFDGNGRMARLLANFPLLRYGFPPIIIPQSERKEYLRFYYTFQKTSISPFPTDADCLKFTAFLAKEWEKTWELIDEAHQAQVARQKSKEICSSSKIPAGTVEQEENKYLTEYSDCHDKSVRCLH